MSNKDINDRDLEDVSGGAVDIQHTGNVNDAKTKENPTSSTSGTGGPGDPGTDDLNQGS